MVEIDTTKVISKRQVVIPKNMREKFKEDLEFAKRTEEAYKRHERGEFKTISADKFLQELQKW